MISRKKCLRLLDKYGIQGDVLKHILKVEEIATFIGTQLKQKGIIVNLKLLSAGALLHDIGKLVADHTKMEHVEAGTIILRGEGFPELAEICKKHAIYAFLKNETTPISWEEKIVNYADKRVLGDVFVSLEDRLVYLRKNLEKKNYSFKVIEKKLKIVEKEIFDVFDESLLEKKFKI